MEGIRFHSVVIFICGVLLWPLLKLLTQKALRSRASTVEKRSRMYGLEHGVLNLELPLTMWMNVGYWKDQLDKPRDFPHACESLLGAVLRSAFRHPGSEVHIPDRICLVDVGIGCGDQSLFLVHPNSSEEGQTIRLDYTGVQIGRPAIEMYVGLTNNPTQYECARSRLESASTLEKSHGSNLSNELGRNYEIYCEDAAIPSRFSSKLTKSLEGLRDHSRPRDDLPVWLLALDTMYHFSPSRVPLLQYAATELKASFMAFDFMLADDEKSPTTMQLLLLRLICLFTSAPYGNFLTQTQYKQMLRSVGYDIDSIEIDDISEYVFEPLSQFMTKKDIQLQSIGLGIGAFRVARWVFSWWGRSGIVRGCIVIARQRKS